MPTYAPKTFSWRNADGLVVYFGPREAVPGNAGEHSVEGPTRLVETLIDLSTLTTSAQYLDQFVSIPKGAFIEQVELEVLVTPVSGGSGTLSFGLKQSDQTTNISDTALVNAATYASIQTNGAGTKILYSKGATGAGGSIGTALAANGLITALVSSTYSAGRVALRVRYSFLPLT